MLGLHQSQSVDISSKRWEDDSEVKQVHGFVSCAVGWSQPRGSMASLYEPPLFFPSLLKQFFWPLSLCGHFYKTHLTVWVLLASYCFSQLNSEPFSCGFYPGQVDSVETINISLHPPTLRRAQYLRARGRGLGIV